MSRSQVLATARMSRTAFLNGFFVVILPVVVGVPALLRGVTSGVTLFELSILVVMFSLTSIGREVGYHRLFSHRSFKTRPAVGAILCILGSMCGQGPLVYWVSTHRCHHQFGDRPGDPHSPHLGGDGWAGAIKGLFHAHLAWMFGTRFSNPVRYARDLYRDPLLLRIDRYYHVWVLLGLGLPAAVGYLVAGGAGAVSGLLWGGVVRMLLVSQVTFAINSVCHRYGARPFASNDRSTNNWLLAIPSFGVSWHNNHHAFPASARHGFRRRQIDMGYWVIALLGRLGLARDITVRTAR